MGQKHPKFYLIRVVDHQYAYIKHNLKDRVPCSYQKEPNSKPKGVRCIGEKERKQKDSKSSYYYDGVIVMFPFLQVFTDESPCEHSKWSATEKIGVLGFYDTCGNTEIGYEGTKFTDACSIDEKTDCIKIEVFDMLVGL